MMILKWIVKLFILTLKVLSWPSLISWDKFVHLQAMSLFYVHHFKAQHNITNLVLARRVCTWCVGGCVFRRGMYYGGLPWKPDSITKTGGCDHPASARRGASASCCVKIHHKAVISNNRWKKEWLKIDHEQRYF